MLNIVGATEKLQAELQESRDTLAKLTAQDAKLDGNLKQLRQAMDSKLQHQQSPGKQQSLLLNEQKLEKQLQRQLQNARAKLKQYHAELKAQTKNVGKGATIEQLFQLEENVRQKDVEIKQLHDEIKELTNVKRRQEKILESRAKLQEEGGGAKIAKLAQEIRGLKELLANLQSSCEKKKEGLQKKQKQIEQLQGKYQTICDAMGEKPITYEQFKERRKQRSKEQPTKKETKRQYQSIKDIIHNKETYDSLEPTQENLMELQYKREIAENALKIAKKKHQRELDQLNKKLAFLQEENTILEGRLKQKEKEKQMAAARFAELKKNTIRKLTPLK